jgi:CBS domain-containing protein
MPVEHYCQKVVEKVAPEEGIRDAARRMEAAGVGLLVVLEDGRTAGVLTDRDIVLHAAEESEFRVSDAMSCPAVPIGTAASVEEAVDLMERSRMRRLLVIDGEGRPFGVLSVDDLVRLLGREMAGLASVAEAQITKASGASGADPDPALALRPFEHYEKEVVSLRSDAPVLRAIEEMRKSAVGCVVVTDGEGQPVGMITDRDIALRVVARGEDPRRIELAAVMSTPVVSCESTQPLDRIVATMRERGVRRIPVTQGGRLVGLVSYDDLLVVLGEEIAKLGKAVKRDVGRESRIARAEELRASARERLEQAASAIADLGEETGRRLKEEIESLRDRLRGSKGGNEEEDHAGRNE